MKRFRIVLVKYYPSGISRDPAVLFFGLEAGNTSGLVELGEGRIIDASLPDDVVAKLQHGYMSVDPAEAVKRFIEHQLGYGSSLQMWPSTYPHFAVDKVTLL